MKHGKGGPMKKNFPHIFKQVDEFGEEGYPTEEAIKNSQ